MKKKKRKINPRDSFNQKDLLSYDCLSVLLPVRPGPQISLLYEVVSGAQFLLRCFSVIREARTVRTWGAEERPLGSVGFVFFTVGSFHAVVHE